MQKINTRDVGVETDVSPKGKYGSTSQGISEALGRERNSTELGKRHPFDLEHVSIPPGKSLCPYHEHVAQWEFYIVLSGVGTIRDEGGTTEVVAGDAFFFMPGQPHQCTNNGTEDFVYYVIADNPFADGSHYPDSGKFMVRKGGDRYPITAERADYYHGEE